ncbi:MAG: zinc ribbon domain-containing protein, partial [Akkermansia sp.]
MKKSFPLPPRMVGWQAMNHADLDQLLILQEKDARIARLRKELAALPEQRTRLLRQMEAIKQKALDAKKEVAGLEKDIRDVEGTIENKRSYIGKMKTLQSNTRKNEEYQKCIQEVEKTEAAIDELENAELELMERLETAKESLAQKILKVQDSQKEMEEILA